MAVLSSIKAYRITCSISKSNYSTDFSEHRIYYHTLGFGGLVKRINQFAFKSCKVDFLAGALGRFCA
jgi:hypothetical protein